MFEFFYVGDCPGSGRGVKFGRRPSITCNYDVPENKLARPISRNGACNRFFGAACWWRRFSRSAPARNHPARGSTISHNAADGGGVTLTRWPGKSRSPVLEAPRIKLTRIKKAAAIDGGASSRLKTLIAPKGATRRHSVSSLFPVELRPLAE